MEELELNVGELYRVISVSGSGLGGTLKNIFQVRIENLVANCKYF